MTAISIQARLFAPKLFLTALGFEPRVLSILGKYVFFELIDHLQPSCFRSSKEICRCVILSFVSQKTAKWFSGVAMPNGLWAPHHVWELPNGHAPCTVCTYCVCLRSPLPSFNHPSRCRTVSPLGFNLHFSMTCDFEGHLYVFSSFFCVWWNFLFRFSVKSFWEILLKLLGCSLLRAKVTAGIVIVVWIGMAGLWHVSVVGVKSWYCFSEVIMS